MDIDSIQRSIVAVSATIPDNAYTAKTLGTHREGSGVVIRENGLVLTIGYLITEATQVWLTLHDGRIVAGHALAYDQETGFGLIQALGALDVPPVRFAESAAVKIGDSVTLIDGSRHAVKSRIVARQEFAGYWEYLLDDALFIAPAHPSWGGAALIDAEGRLVGIGSLRLQMSRGGEVADINMIVPIDLLAPILDDVLNTGQVNRAPRPWLGAFSAEASGGVVVMSVADHSPAQLAGLKRGDVISEIRDGEVGGLADFYRKVWDSGPAGVEIPMRVIRNGRDAWVRVKSADRNALLQKPQLQ